MTGAMTTKRTAVWRNSMSMWREIDLVCLRLGVCLPRKRNVFFFFQAEDGMRDIGVTGVQTCALPIFRPINYPAGAPGQGWHTVLVGETRVTIVNALGRTFMEPLDNPFLALDRLLASPPGDLDAVFVDFHAEATSEKRALGWYLDGCVAAVVGTHTHVPTADAQVLPKGTAYVTDVGMCGPRHSVIGMAVESSVERFVIQRPTRYEVAREGPLDFNAVLIEIDRASGRGVSIRRVDRVEQPTTPS